MKYTLCVLLFVAYVAVSHSQDTPPPPNMVAYSHESLRPLKRVARQNMPPPEGLQPPPDSVPPPPDMPIKDYTFVRKKREARGIGSLPTRKG